MDASLTNNNLTRSNPWIRIVKIAGPPALAIFLAWGTAQFTLGRQAEKLDRVEQDAAKALTRDEFKTWTNEQRDRLSEIRQDIRELRESTK